MKLLILLAGIAITDCSVMDAYKQYRSRELLTHGDYVTTEKHCNDLLVDDPYNVQTNFNLGVALYYQDKYEAAVIALERAAQCAAQLHDNALIDKIYTNLGNAQSQRKQFEEALAAYEQALVANSNNKQAINNIELIKKYLAEQKKRNEQEKQQRQQGDENQSDRQNEQQRNQNKSDNKQSPNDLKNDGNTDQNNDGKQQQSKSGEQQANENGHDKSPQSGSDNNEQQNSKNAQQQQNNDISNKQQKQRSMNQEKEHGTKGTDTPHTKDEREQKADMKNGQQSKQNQVHQTKESDKKQGPQLNTAMLKVMEQLSQEDELGNKMFIQAHVHEAMKEGNGQKNW